MPDLLHDLITDVDCFLKNPLNKERSLLLATREEYALFFEAGTQKSIPAPSLLEKGPPMPRYEPANPVLVPKKEKTPPLQKEEILVKPTPQMPSTASSLQIKDTLAKIAPHLRLTEKIPDDSVSRKINTTWKERISDADVLLLACDHDAETIAFLKALAKAIDTHLAKAKILPADRLEREGVWDLFLSANPCRLILASEGFHQLKNGKRFYRERPSEQRCFLDQTPFFPLLSADVYKQLDKKAQLWKALCQLLKTS